MFLQVDRYKKSIYCILKWFVREIFLHLGNEFNKWGVFGLHCQCTSVSKTRTRTKNQKSITKNKNFILEAVKNLNERIKAIEKKLNDGKLDYCENVKYLCVSIESYNNQRRWCKVYQNDQSVNIHHSIHCGLQPA